MDDTLFIVKATKTRAETIFAKSLADKFMLVGFQWLPDLDAVRSVEDFDIESVGTVEAFGTERERREWGWVVYSKFLGKAGKLINLKSQEESC